MTAVVKIETEGRLGGVIDATNPSRHTVTMHGGSHKP